MIRTSIVIDERTVKRIDEYAEARAQNRSATIRLILNDFFIKQEGRA